MKGKYNTVYDFTKPIHLRGYRRGYLAHFIYFFMMFMLVLAVALLLFFKDGHLTWNFTLWRVLVSFPLVNIIYFINDMVREDEKYTKLLLKQTHWSLEDLMKLTGKPEKETKDIITRVLEMSFEVDPSCILYQPPVSGK